MIPPAPPDRRPGSYDLDAASNEAAYVETMPSLTVQSMTEDADLNVLMKRFGITGSFPQSPRIPHYGDFTHITDYRSALEAIQSAESSFMEYPADFRALFENNPQKFLEYAENPGNIDQMRKWFPRENLSVNQGNSSGSSASSGGVASSSGGAGAPQVDGGAIVSK